MNTKLVEYGIQTERSDWRAHVCFRIGYVYAFRTKAAQELLRSKEYPQKEVFQRNIVTAIGRLVPVGDIPDIREVEIPRVLREFYTPAPIVDTPTKGNCAAGIVKELLIDGRFPVPVQAEDLDNLQVQILGMDIRVIEVVGLKIQVKCDYRGGRKELGGTGNLFFQTHECNPYKLH